MPHASQSGIRHHIIIVATDNSFQQQIASHLINNLNNDLTQVDLVSPDGISEDTHNKQTLFIAIGNSAIMSLHDHDKNENVLRLSSRPKQGLASTSTQADLLISQPACRQLQLVKALQQGWKSVAVLASKKSADATSKLTRCALQLDINLKIYAIAGDSDLLQTVDEATDDNEVILAIPDPVVYNSSTLKKILITAYRKRTPVVGYSRSFVESGAIASVYASAEAISDKAAEVIDDFFVNQHQFLQRTYYPDEFIVSTNFKVAKSFGIKIPSEATIEKRLSRATSN